MQRVSVDRVLVPGDASQLAQQKEKLARLSPHIRDLALYTSDSNEFWRSRFQVRRSRLDTIAHY